MVVGDLGHADVAEHLARRPIDSLQEGEHPARGIARIKISCLVVFGREAIDGERERLGRLPDVQIEEWAGDGHFVHLVDPERFATRLRALLEHCDQAG